MKFLSFVKWALKEAKNEELSDAWSPIKQLASVAADHLGIKDLRGAKVKIYTDTYFTVSAANGRFLFTVDGGSEDDKTFWIHPDNSATTEVENPLYWDDRGKNSGKKFDF